MYEQDMVNVFCPLRRYLALLYFAMHGTRMGITFMSVITVALISQHRLMAVAVVHTCLFPTAVLFYVSLNTYKTAPEKRDCVMYELTGKKVLL